LIFVCKPSSYPLISEYITGADLAGREDKFKHGKFYKLYRYRWIEKVPLRDGKDALEVNWFEIQIVKPDGAVTYRNSFITDLPFGRDTVVERAACGRAPWKIENESFNVLKTQGYNIEHNFGHGKQNLAIVLATLNLLAFAIHTVFVAARRLVAELEHKIGNDPAAGAREHGAKHRGDIDHANRHVLMSPSNQFRTSL
jgi:hypothetical protein